MLPASAYTMCVPSGVQVARIALMFPTGWGAPAGSGCTQSWITESDPTLATFETNSSERSAETGPTAKTSWSVVAIQVVSPPAADT